MQINRPDFITIPTQDTERSRAFYRDVLQLRPDDKAEYEFWAGDTCFAIWDPSSAGMPFAPNGGGHIAWQVDDVAAARAELEAKGVSFDGDIFDTGVCHMAMFKDPDGNAMMLHHRHTPRD